MSSYPIQRLVVYNVVPGTSHILWDLHPNMKDPGPYTYQLQVNRLPNPDSGEWENVGDPQVDVTQLEDSITESNGYKLDKYYRIILTTSRGQYTSPIEGCFGQLHRYEWKLVQEIIRKEMLRHNNVSIPCVLLKRRTSGETCPHCTDVNSGSSNNSECTYCYGTGYYRGYYAPLKFQLIEIYPTQLLEKHESDNVTTLNMSIDRYEARAMGVPEICVDDVIVDLSTSQRFRVNGSQSISQLRRVPIARKLDLTLLPYSDPVYKIDIGENNYKITKSTIPEGCGYALIDHDFKNKDDLQYVYQGHPVAGATIVVKDAQAAPDTDPIFTTSTDAQGRWNSGYMANIGSYTVTFYKEGFYGPDTTTIEVTAEDLQSLPIKEQERYNQDTVIKHTDYTKKFL